MTRIYFLLFVFVSAFFLSGYLYVWVTMGQGTFWRGISKRSLYDIFRLLIEAKKNESEDYPELLKRTIVYFLVMIVFSVFLGLILVSLNPGNICNL